MSRQTDVTDEIPNEMLTKLRIKSCGQHEPKLTPEHVNADWRCLAKTELAEEVVIAIATGRYSLEECIALAKAALGEA